ncbi:MAG: ABC transporter ATP-binding protein/permease [Lachnoclostridium sp.]|nr:ABC transporter ATP-binding protein/permease [Muribaculaceae bacterium]MCM1144116.1 ABC transporter ATP-binding protein/permease [Lachnoclostridium sp.]
MKNFSGKNKSNLSRLMGYAGKHKILTYLSWVLSAISALLALVPFWYIWRIIHDILEVSPNFAQAANVTRYGWSAVLFAVISIIVYIAALMCSHISAFRIASNIRKELMQHITALPLGVTEKYGSGKLRRIVNTSSNAAETYLAHRLPDKAGAIATPIGLLFLLLAFDWRLGLLCLVPVILGFLIMMSMTGKGMEQKMKEYQNALSDMSNEAVEYVRGVPVVKTFGQTIFSFKRFKATIDNYEKWVIAYTISLRLPMMFYTTAINGVFAFLIAGGVIFTRGGVTNELLLNIIFYIVITPVIGITLTKIMYMSEDEMIVGDAISRIDEVLNESPLPENTRMTALVNNMPPDNSITLEHVSYSYDGEKNALEDVSLSIPAGQTIALVGPSGGGKTTLANIVTRFFDPDEGRVLIGNTDIRDIPKEALMDKVSFVFQNSRLLKTSILENVRMGKPSATREEVADALEAAQCMDIIEKLPNGIDTVVGTNGVYLSGGEQQRIAIARAILKNAPILILDEATAFADPDNEVRVQQALSALSKVNKNSPMNQDSHVNQDSKANQNSKANQVSPKKTVIMIAHRLSSITDADCIYVLQDGKITESGTHGELIAQNRLFARMWENYSEAATWRISSETAGKIPNEKSRMEVNA